VEFDTRAGVVLTSPSIELHVRYSGMSVVSRVLKVQVAVRVVPDSVGLLPQSPDHRRMTILADRVAPRSVRC
jgi:hypothetical protein